MLTLTCDTYGKVGPDGTPLDPGSYDYQRAARDAIHFPALFDRVACGDGLRPPLFEPGRESPVVVSYRGMACSSPTP